MKLALVIFQRTITDLNLSHRRVAIVLSILRVLLAFQYVKVCLYT